ncbi:MAG TPA: Ig-like domain-containing protein [Terracidiphilus sp.]|jgi:hypothetical protein
MRRRSVRLYWVAGLGIALGLGVLPEARAAQSVATETTLNVGTSDRGGHTFAAVTVNVADEYGLPATGAVDIDDGDRMLAEVALTPAGQATTTVELPEGAHALRAVYSGDATHTESASPVSEAQGTASATPNFQLTLTPISPATFPMVLTDGASGTAEVTVTPENNATLTTPMFVTLSCSGLPNEASCTFSPETVEILPTTPASCPAGSPVASCPPISSMLVQTQNASNVGAAVPQKKGNPVAWAFLLPGVLGLGGLAWGARRRLWLKRMTLVVLLGLVATMGATACSPLYRYYQHGPGSTPATPTGTYNVTVTAQSSNGVTAITNSTTMVLTVQ